MTRQYVANVLQVSLSLNWAAVRASNARAGLSVSSVLLIATRPAPLVHLATSLAVPVIGAPHCISAWAIARVLLQKQRGAHLANTSVCRRRAHQIRCVRSASQDGSPARQMHRTATVAQEDNTSPLLVLLSVFRVK